MRLTTVILCCVIGAAVATPGRRRGRRDVEDGTFDWDNPYGQTQWFGDNRDNLEDLQEIYPEFAPDDEDLARMGVDEWSLDDEYNGPDPNQLPEMEEFEKHAAAFEQKVEDFQNAFENSFPDPADFGGEMMGDESNSYGEQNGLWDTSIVDENGNLIGYGNEGDAISGQGPSEDQDGFFFETDFGGDDFGTEDFGDFDMGMGGDFGFGDELGGGGEGFGDDFEGPLPGGWDSEDGQQEGGEGQGQGQGQQGPPPMD